MRALDIPDLLRDVGISEIVLTVAVLTVEGVVCP
jgi:hypothetical protein